MRLIACTVTVLLIFCANLVCVIPAVADIQQDMLTQFFNQRLAGIADDINVVVQTPLNPWPVCEQPVLSLPGNKLWGKLSVTVSCGSLRRFVRVSVLAKGHYVVTSSAIERGGTLNNSNVRLQYGVLNTLPARTLLSLTEAQGAVALRDLAAGQPLQSSMLRRAWRVRGGQQVQVVINEPGFSASSAGQALDNAAVSQSVRVRMPSGTIVSGIVQDDGVVLLTE